jgi:hypothetical protein
MINFIFRLLLTLNATSLLIVVFLVQKGYSLGYFFSDFLWVVQLPNFISYTLYILVPVIFTAWSVMLSVLLGKDEFSAGEISSIEYANNSFLPSYLGYFFVALSISGWDALFFVYGVLFVFTFLSQALYFNPLFLIFGYKFYNIKTTSGLSIFLISRVNYKKPLEVVIPKVYRINDYTFIERGKYGSGVCKNKGAS